MTPDYILWPAGAAPVTRDALAPMLIAAFTAYEITSSFEREDAPWGRRTVAFRARHVAAGGFLRRILAASRGA